MDAETVVEDAVTLDSLFEALGHERRLQVLLRLHTADPGETYRAADLVAADEDPDAVVVSLYHVHFPKLADLELVEWDREENAVRRGPAFPAVERVFERTVGSECLEAGGFDEER